MRNGKTTESIFVKDALKLTKQYRQIQVKINRLISKKTTSINFYKRLSIMQRQARTRTLIQAGGLLNQIGLLEYCGIQTGEDLQSDLLQHGKAAVLLGLLIETMEQLPEQLSESKRTHWKSLGIRQLKLQKARNYHK